MPAGPSLFHLSYSIPTLHRAPITIPINPQTLSKGSQVPEGLTWFLPGHCHPLELVIRMNKENSSKEMPGRVLRTPTWWFLGVNMSRPSRGTTAVHGIAKESETT